MAPSTIWGLQERKTTLPKAVAMKREAGTSEKKILSNAIVKSKSPRHRRSYRKSTLQRAYQAHGFPQLSMVNNECDCVLLQNGGDRWQDSRRSAQQQGLAQPRISKRNTVGFAATPKNNAAATALLGMFDDRNVAVVRIRFKTY
ncbi:hypothetical protein GB937_006772 [Aspergillus fischeri]|nr:hypothetical protein GB937_006772 [Aspergillus fischeri]